MFLAVGFLNEMHESKLYEHMDASKLEIQVWKQTNIIR